MFKEIWRSPNEWVLIESSDNALILCVNSGTYVGYQTNHLLTFGEREQYLNAGWVYLDVLASKVVNNPWAFATDGITAPAIDFTSRGPEDVYIPPGR